MRSNHRYMYMYKIRFQDIAYLKLNLNIKKYQQKELNQMRETGKKNKKLHLFLYHVRKYHTEAKKIE